MNGIKQKKVSFKSHKNPFRWTNYKYTYLYKKKIKNMEILCPKLIENITKINILKLYNN